MKRIEQHLPARSQEDWEKLIERYFEAETSSEEELQLRAFLVTQEADKPAFDEVKAVMGFLCTGKRLHLKQQEQAMHKHRLTLIHRRLSIAAVAICLLGSALWFLNARQDEDVCVAYINGVKCTDVEVVMSQMHQSIERVHSTEEDVTMKDQLHDMMQTLNKEDSQKK